MRKLAAIVTIALVALLLQSCTPKTQFRTLRQIASEHTLRVYVNPAGEPFAYAGRGEAQGVEVDLMREFAETIGVEAVFTVSSYDEITLALNAGEADVAIGKMALPGEGYPAGYSLPIARDRMYVVCRRGRLYGDLASLEGMKVGVLNEGGVAGLPPLSLPPDTELVQMQNLNAVAGYITDGAVDAALCMTREAKLLMQEYGEDLSCRDVVGLEPLCYAAVVARGNDTLLAALNEFITESAMGESSNEQDDKA